MANYGVDHYLLNATYETYEQINGLSAGRVQAVIVKVFGDKPPSREDAFWRVREELDGPGRFFRIISVDLVEVRHSLVESWSDGREGR